VKTQKIKMTIITKQDAKNWLNENLHQFDYDRLGVSYVTGGSCWKNGYGDRETIFFEKDIKKYFWNYNTNNGSCNRTNIEITEKEAIKFIFDNRKYINYIDKNSENIEG
jgi:hypothetical protein